MCTESEHQQQAQQFSLHVQETLYEKYEYFRDKRDHQGRNMMQPERNKHHAPVRSPIIGTGSSSFSVL
jgi:hypothetical protein